MKENISRIEMNVAIYKLINSLADYLQSSKVYFSYYVLHLSAEDSNKMMEWIEIVKERISSAFLSDYNVLVEYPIAYASKRFVMHGNSFVCEQLAKNYGGRISNGKYGILGKYWILYNEPLTNYNHGYREKLPTAEEIAGYIEKISAMN